MIVLSQDMIMFIFFNNNACFIYFAKLLKYFIGLDAFVMRTFYSSVSKVILPSAQKLLFFCILLFLNNIITIFSIITVLKKNPFKVQEMKAITTELWEDI